MDQYSPPKYKLLGWARDLARGLKIRKKLDPILTNRFDLFNDRFVGPGPGRPREHVPPKLWNSLLFAQMLELRF